MTEAMYSTERSNQEEYKEISEANDRTKESENDEKVNIEDGRCYSVDKKCCIIQE